MHAGGITDQAAAPPRARGPARGTHALELGGLDFRPALFTGQEQWSLLELPPPSATDSNFKSVAEGGS